MTPAAENALPFPPEAFVALFLVAFPLMWVLVLWFIAALGWRRVEAVYPATSDPPLSAPRLTWASMNIAGPLGGANYSNCVNAWLSDTGLWLRPSLLFRPFHPMIFIPWTQVRSVERRRVLLFESVHVELAGDAPDLRLMGRLGNAVLERRPPVRA